VPVPCADTGLPVFGSGVQSYGHPKTDNGGNEQLAQGQQAGQNRFHS